LGIKFHDNEQHARHATFEVGLAGLQKLLIIETAIVGVCRHIYYIGGDWRAP
jgi:hypothetical protein